tara:strand:- start:242 stop:2725 length:2484 start_codon:yes stop_codon:yes gene_type:complete
MILLGNVRPYGTGGSWFFSYGDKLVGNYEEKAFLKEDYGTSAKAKAAALKYQKDSKLQKRLKDNSKIGKIAKSLGLSYDEYVKLPQSEKTKRSREKSVKKIRGEKVAAGGFEQTFTSGGKKYTIPTRFPKEAIPKLKEFLKSFDEWKAGGGNLQSYLDLPSRKKSMAAAKAAGLKVSKFDNRAGNVWRRLVQYAKGKAPIAPGGTGTGEVYKNIFDQLDISKPQLNTIKNFDFENIQKLKQEKITKTAAIKNIGNPLVPSVIDFVKKNPDIRTEQELFAGVSKLAGKGLSNSEITKAAVQAHRNGTSRLLKESRGETIGPNILKNVKNIESGQLPVVLKTLFNIFPSQIGRDFAGTVEEFYRDNPTLKKRALQKLKDYGVIRKRVTDAFELGKKGRQGAAFQFDHPISFAALQRSGDIEGAIRTNPIMGDVNQWKLGLDRKLNNLQQAIMKGTDIDANIAKVEKLKNINQTLFGNLAGDFTIDKTGKINVIDYGAPKLLDPQYDIAKSAAKNIPLGGFIKKTLASGRLTPELTEVFGEKSATNLINRSKKLIEFADKDTNQICRIFGGAKLAEGGRGCGAQMAAALEEDPVGTAGKIQNLKTEGVNRIKGVATGFLNFLKSPGVKRFTLAGVAGAAGTAFVKEFRNDDRTSYLSNEDQQKNMLVDMATNPIAPDLERPAILDYQLPALGATVAGATALSAPSTIKASRSRGLGVERKGVARTAGRVLGRGLGVAASPGLLAPLAGLDLARQVSEGDSISDVATDPLNYLYPAFADQTPKLTRGLPSAVRGIASLGMSPAALRVLSRAGILGFGASLGIQGMKLLQDD